MADTLNSNPSRDGKFNLKKNLNQKFEKFSQMPLVHDNYTIVKDFVLSCYQTTRKLLQEKRGLGIALAVTLVGAAIPIAAMALALVAFSSLVVLATAAFVVAFTLSSAGLAIVYIAAYKLITGTYQKSMVILNNNKENLPANKVVLDCFKKTFMELYASTKVVVVKQWSVVYAKAMTMVNEVKAKAAAAKKAKAEAAAAKKVEEPKKSEEKKEEESVPKTEEEKKTE